MITGISAVIVTKGDQDLSRILQSLPFEDVVVWDNSKKSIDFKIYGRYLAMREAKHPYIFCQDDDCIVPAGDLVDEFWRGSTGEICCNVPPEHRKDYAGTGITLLGFGAVFHRDMAERRMREYLDQYPADEIFLRECDRVFTGLNRFREVYVGLEKLPHAFGSDRMGTEKRHAADFREIRRRLSLMNGVLLKGELSVA